MSTPIESNQLSTSFQEFLAASGLIPEDVPAWKPVNKFEINRLLRTGSHNKIKCDCIAIPYATLDGQPVRDRGEQFVRARLLEPETVTRADGAPSTKKYASPAGSGSVLYIPGKLEKLLTGLDANQDCPPPPLVITEGEKKAEALVKIGVPAVGLAGVSMGLLRDDPTDKASPRKLLLAIPAAIEAYIAACGDRPARVLVLFDSDGLPGQAFPGSHALKDGKHVGNKSVFFEALLLAKELRNTKFSRGVVVSPAWCPQGEVDSGQPGKQGVDDWIEAAKKEFGSPESVLTALGRLADGSAAPTTSVLNAANPNAAQRLGYRALGYEGETGVVWSRATQQLVRMSSSELSRAASIMFAVGPSYAMNTWPKVAKNGDVSLDTTAAAGDIITDCHAAGAWTDSRERGGGVWLEDDVLRISAREGLFEATADGVTALPDDSRFTGKHVYPACGRFSIGSSVEADAQVPDAQLARSLVNHFKQWGWKTPASPYLLAGWVCQQAYLGALEARPSVTLIGESGAGKTVLAEHIGEMLGGTAYRIEDGAGTTSAGMRQTIGKDAMTILLDEAEPGANQAQVAEQRAATMRRTLDMLRAAYSSADGGNVRTTIKGSASGKAVDYSIRVSAMINAINRPDFDQADRNRFLMLEVIKEGRGGGEPRVEGLADLGRQIRFRLWTRHAVFHQILAHIIGMDGLGEARLRKTWGTPIAALMALSYGDAWAQRIPAIEQLVRAVATEQGEQGGDSGETDQDKARRALMSAQIDCEVLEERGESVSVALRKRTVFEVFQSAEKRTPKSPDTRAAQALKRVGLMRLDGQDGPRLFVSDGPQLRNALRGTPWSTGQSIVGSLARLPGAEMTQSRPVDTRQLLDGSRRSGVFIPLGATDGDQRADPDVGF